MTSNPAPLAGRNRQPAPRAVRVYSRTELDALAAELPPIYAPLPIRRRHRAAAGGVAGARTPRR